MSRSLRAIAIVLSLAALPAAAQVTLFEHEGFQGRTFSTGGTVRNLDGSGFNDRASSAIVRAGRFEVCEHASFGGRCVVLRPGQYPSLAAMGMNDRISSVRFLGANARVEEHRYSPPPPVAYDYRPRRGEKLFQADVVAVRAVYGQPEQRCWVERERVHEPQANPEGAVVGAIIGGILGHEMSGGHGAGTAAGAAAGAAIGSQVGRGPYGTTFTRDVQRCREVPGSARPAYWDVTYRFRGVDRYVQMTRPPGPTITVNRDGEPRG